MKTITVTARSGESRLLINEKLENLHKYCNANETIVITDNNVAGLYGSRFSNFRTIIIDSGEKNKNFETVANIYKKLLEFSCDRHSFIVGIGGGVVTDITGFVASTFLRGIRYAFVPTTLLAQVDAAVGGKNGINFMQVKNVAGTFSQPDFVLIDVDVLKTLDKKEFVSGLGEIIKCAVISGGDFFARLAEDLLRLGIPALAPVIPACCDTTGSRETLSRLIEESLKLKVDIVEKDEKETGLRKILNLGHTLAHAIEIVENISHGAAVIKGIKFASDLSTKQGFLNTEENKKITSLLELTGIPLSLGIKIPQNKINDPSASSGILNPSARIKEALLHDKKKKGETIDFVFIRNIGDVFVANIELKTVMEAIDDLCINR